MISTLIGSISHGSDTWIIDSGASKHMIGHRDSFSCLTQKYYLHKVQLRDNYQYPIKGLGEASYKLKYGKSMKMKEVLYVPGLKNNILSISALDIEKLHIFLCRWWSSNVSKRKNYRSWSCNRYWRRRALQYKRAYIISFHY